MEINTRFINSSRRERAKDRLTCARRKEKRENVGFSCSLFVNSILQIIIPRVFFAVYRIFAVCLAIIMQWTWLLLEVIRGYHMIFRTAIFFYVMHALLSPFLTAR